MACLRGDHDSKAPGGDRGGGPGAVRATFILLHVGHWPQNLDFVDATLRKFPNTYVELGAREAELAQQTRRAREFFLKNASRIMFGTDMDPEIPPYQNYFRRLPAGDAAVQADVEHRGTGPPLAR